ncbi:MAG TPA: beta-L-arabinofuranosidase domain-containing protein [Jatrophihabitans sp.]|nr:beta-L-arabinofuranosidase domain-containing protein [Jatrophihabitans sp.]
MSSVTRRRFLGMSAAGITAAATTGVLRGPTAHAEARAQPLPRYVGAGSTAPVRPFQLSAVRLGSSLFQEKRDRMKDFIRQFDGRRFLVLFNNNAGRPNPPGVPVVGGWEDGGQLSGHWTGYYLTALAQCYADQGEQVYKDKLDWMVNELAAVQEAITAKLENPPEPEPVEIGRVAGRFGNALQLNGSSPAQYVTLPAAIPTQLTDFTIATWVRLGSTDTWSRIFDFGQNTGVYMFLTPRAGVTGTPPRFAITAGGAGQEQQVTGGAALPIGEWVHLAVTLAGGSATLYVNGQVAGTNANMTLNPTRLGTLSNVWIGRSEYSDPYLNATVDEFQVFDRALTQVEVASLVDSAAGTTGGGNIAWYRFDESSGVDALDSSPHGRTATIVPAPDPAAWVPTFPGYLGALPDDLVLRLGPPRFATYGGDSGTWAPWYTQHKLMRGLLDAYELTGSEQALQVVATMAGWAHLALTIGDKNNPDYPGPITRADLNFMWDTYIAGEFGAANEPITEIYALTGDPKHLETAKLFDNRQSLFGACVENRDILVVTSANNPGPRRPNRLHANQHIPNNLGYLRIAEQTGDDEYLQAAKHFFGMVIPHRMYAIGGTGGNYPGSNNNIEQFQNRDNVANALVPSGSETEATHSLIQVARNLFFHEPDAAYLDYYERAVVNQILGSRADADSTTNPLITYFQPQSPGATRSYGNLGTGDGGAGLQDQTKYQELIYARSADGSTLWVNLYIASTLTWAERDLVVTQETDFPRADRTRLTVDASGRLDVKLRVPSWARLGFTVAINGVAQDVGAVPGNYVTLRRTWTPGDTVDVSMPFGIRIERAIDRPDTQSIFWGPVLMPILGDPGAGVFRELTLYRYLKRDGDYSRAAITPAGTTSAGDQLFTTNGMSLRPWYIGDTQAHSAYFRRVEPAIVFGTIDSGVPNYKRDDGLPRYDVPVAGVPSPGHDGLSFLDIVWDQAPFAGHGRFASTVAGTADDFVARGLFTPAEKDAVVSAAARASDELTP